MSAVSRRAGAGARAGEAPRCGGGSRRRRRPHRRRLPAEEGFIRDSVARHARRHARGPRRVAPAKKAAGVTREAAPAKKGGRARQRTPRPAERRRQRRALRLLRRAWRAGRARARTLSAHRRRQRRVPRCRRRARRLGRTPFLTARTQAFPLRAAHPPSPTNCAPPRARRCSAARHQDWSLCGAAGLSVAVNPPASRARPSR